MRRRKNQIRRTRRVWLRRHIRRRLFRPMVLSTITGNIKCACYFIGKSTCFNGYVMSIIDPGPAQHIYKSTKFHRFKCFC